jgi:hypothetical protein
MNFHNRFSTWKSAQISSFITLSESGILYRLMLLARFAFQRAAAWSFPPSATLRGNMLPAPKYLPASCLVDKARGISYSVW